MARQHPKLTDTQRWRRYALRRLGKLLLIIAAVAALVLADRYGVFGRQPTADRADYDGLTVTCVKVVDGDTLDVDIPDGRHATTRIRLWGVDTPETVKDNTPVQHFGPEATALTKRLALDKPVTLRLEPNATPRDKHGRLLAYVMLPDGRMLNRVLLETGHAYADPRYDHHLRDEFLDLQARALKQRQGLWKEAHSSDLPYYWQGKVKLPSP